MTIPQIPLFFLNFISGLIIFWFIKENINKIIIFINCIQIELTKKIREYFIVPNDVSNKEAFFTQTKKANIIWNIFVVINTEVIRRHNCKRRSVYEGILIK